MPCGLSWAAAIVFARFVVGLGVVGCYQAGNTYVAESAPATVRGYYMALLHVTIAIGGLCSVALAVALPPQQWRLLLCWVLRRQRRSMRGQHALACWSSTQAAAGHRLPSVVKLGQWPTQSFCWRVTLWRSPLQAGPVVLRELRHSISC